MPYRHKARNFFFWAMLLRLHYNILHAGINELPFSPDNNALLTALTNVDPTHRE